MAASPMADLVHVPARYVVPQSKNTEPTAKNEEICIIEQVSFVVEFIDEFLK